ncbi:PRC-barrel domain containing protein [Halobium salinum]|uniref:PRC-barrel domain containing protein n=1 Tax=Halobium salinum TaxID=1364940 RepID=A0ABD5PGE2_9EURY|nr:PRC-barrel domain containing protein [Halobium salinum]
MSTELAFSDSDEGKPVADANGRPVGRIVEVQGGVAYLRLDPDVADAVAATLGWTDYVDDEAHPLRYERVAVVCRDEVRLSQTCF